MPLRELASVRLVASFGAGGVLYLTPMVFHQAEFSASAVGLGLALAALAGTVGRFISGGLLDQGRSCGMPILLAALSGLIGDSCLLGAQELQGYIVGQLFLGPDQRPTLGNNRHLAGVNRHRRDFQRRRVTRRPNGRRGAARHRSHCHRSNDMALHLHQAYFFWISSEMFCGTAS